MVRDFEKLRKNKKHKVMQVFFFVLKIYVDGESVGVLKLEPKMKLQKGLFC